jgi:ubiquinone/menaquinone biosynthesis C-methylase UbiE
MIEEQVQVIINSTNGIHYTDRVNKLTSYPRYTLPFEPAKKPDCLLLDIGCGWGRWLVAADDKNYIPVGLDLIPEFAETSLKVLQAHNKTGYCVIGDLEKIPFIDNVFDVVWSFSVIQHTHCDKMTSCLSHINRILTRDGFTFLEFPNKKGIRNRMGTAQKWEQYKDIREGHRHLSVRYYTPGEYKEFFTREFGNFSFTNHSFIGIGVLKDDLKYVSFKNKILCSISLFGSLLTNVVPGLKYWSDSIYIKAV